MIDSAGVLRITDFGLANMAGSESESDGGTLFYMAPEKFVRGQHADHRADIYAFGIVLYQLVTGGDYPYTLPATPSAAAMEIARAHLSEPFRRISSPLFSVIEKCVYKIPFDGFLARSCEPKSSHSPAWAASQCLSRLRSRTLPGTSFMRAQSFVTPRKTS